MTDQTQSFQPVSGRRVRLLADRLRYLSQKSPELKDALEIVHKLPEIIAALDALVALSPQETGQ